MDEGYIKFSSERIDGEVPDSARLSALIHARTRLFDLGLIGSYTNGIGYGNVSMRASSGQFVVSASATGALRTLSSAHFCLVEVASFEHNYVRSIGKLPASSESMTHGAIYAANDAVQCVIHIHSRRLFDVLVGCGALTTVKDIPYGTPAMAAAVMGLAQTYRDLPVLFVMAGHDEGVVAYGASIESTIECIVSTVQKELAT